MAKSTKKQELDLVKQLVQSNYLFQGLDEQWIASLLSQPQPILETLYSNRPVYTAFQPGENLDVLYLTISGGPVIVRSSPLDRIISITYPGSCFGMRSLSFSHAQASQSFPSLVEAYKTTEVVKIPVDAVQAMYRDNEVFRSRYDYLFELREKFQYHLLNCSTYPPQAVAALLRALIYQEKALGNQPNDKGIYNFDLPVDIIARASQLNHRTIEQVLKGMKKEGLIELAKSTDSSEDLLHILDAEALKAVYSATREKVSWWPLR
jgi:CRP-like cAMP-binding protein